MTVTFRTKPAIDVYVPNDNKIRVDDEFNINFAFLEVEDYIYVYLRKLDGEVLELNYDIDYSVATTDGLNSVYGKVVFKQNFKSIEKVCIRRNITMDQLNQFSSQTFFSSTIERSFDKLTMMIQDYAIKDYLISAPDDDTPEEEKIMSPTSRFLHADAFEEIQAGDLVLAPKNKRANKYWKCDYQGNLTFVDGISDGTVLRIALGDSSADDPDVQESFNMDMTRCNKILGFDEIGAAKFVDIDWDFAGKLDAALRLKDETFTTTLTKGDIKNKILAFDENGEPKCIDNEFDQIKGKVTANISNIDELKGKLPNIESSITLLQKDSETLKTEIPGIKNEITTLQNDSEKLKKEIDADIDGITTSLSAVEGSVGTLESSVVDTNTQLSKAKDEITVNSDKISELQSTINGIDLSACLRSETGSLKPIEGNRANKYLAFDDKEEPILVTPSLGIPISPTYPRIYFVDKNNGIDSNTGLAFNTPLATISKAIEKINEVQEDSIIFVAPGEYAEKLQFNIMNNASIHMYGANAILKGRIQTVSTSAYMNLAVSGTIGTFSIKPNVNIQTFALNPNLNDVIINWDTDILALSQSTIRDAIGDTSDSYYKFQLNIRARTFTLNGLLTIELSKYTSHVKISAEDATLNAMVKIKDASLTSQAVRYNLPLNIMFDFKVWNVSLTESELFNVSLPKEIAFVLKLKGLNFYTNSTTPMLNITSNAANNYTLIDIDFDCSYFPDNITGLAYLNADAAIFINADLGITRMKYNFTPNDKIKITQSRWL